MPLNPADGYPYTPVEYAEFAGDRKKQSMQFILDIDTAMRANYAANIVNIGNNIFPILYAESTFDGGRYTLVVDEHTSYVKQNVGPKYDVAKAFCHIPLGIYSILSGYGIYSNYKQWSPALLTYKEQILLAGDNWKEVGEEFGLDYKINIDIIFGESLSFIDKVIKKGSFSYDEFAAYSHGLNESILILQLAAAKEQVNVMTATLEQWKNMLGQSTWDNLYVVSNAIWTLTQENAHELIIKEQMKADLRETHVVVTEAAPTLDDAKTLLGRIVGDRIMAELVFDKNLGEAVREDIYSLSTRRDLLSQAIEKVLGNNPAGARTLAAMCPHLNS